MSFIGIGIGIAPKGAMGSGGSAALVQRFAGTGNRIGLSTGTFSNVASKDRTRYMGRTVHYFGARKPIELRVMAFGWYLGANSEIEMSGTKTVQAAIELGDESETVAVTWNGGDPTATLLSTDAYVLSDPLTVDDFTDLAEWPAFVFNRLAYKAAVGDQYPNAGSSAYDTAEGEFAVAYTAAGEAGLDPVTATGGMESAPNSEFVLVNTAGPAQALVGTFPQGYPVVGIPGDSIPNGSVDTQILSGFGKNGGGPVQRGLWNIDGAGTKIDWVRLCANAHKTETAIGESATKRQALYPFISVAVTDFGINDLSNGSSVSANIRGWLQTLAAELRAAGVVPYHTLIGPRTFTTDNWQTLVNQTPAGFNAKRLEVNGFIADDIGETYWAGLVTGWVEACVDGTETSKWKVDGTEYYATPDGLHPSAAIIPGMAEAIADWGYAVLSLAGFAPDLEALDEDAQSLQVAGGTTTVTTLASIVKPAGATRLLLGVSLNSASYANSVSWQGKGAGAIPNTKTHANSSVSVEMFLLNVSDIADGASGVITVVKDAAPRHGAIAYQWLFGGPPAGDFKVAVANSDTSSVLDITATVSPDLPNGKAFALVAKQGTDVSETWSTDTPGATITAEAEVASVSASLSRIAWIEVDVESTDDLDMNGGDGTADRAAICTVYIPLA